MKKLSLAGFAVGALMMPAMAADLAPYPGLRLRPNPSTGQAPTSAPMSAVRGRTSN